MRLLISKYKWQAWCIREARDYQTAMLLEKLHKVCGDTAFCVLDKARWLFSMCWDLQACSSYHWSLYEVLVLAQIWNKARKAWEVVSHAQKQWMKNTYQDHLPDFWKPWSSLFSAFSSRYLSSSSAQSGAILARGCQQSPCFVSLKPSVCTQGARTNVLNLVELHQCPQNTRGLWSFVEKSHSPEEPPRSRGV